jgi:hypothetical protein
MACYNLFVSVSVAPVALQCLWPHRCKALADAHCCIRSSVTRDICVNLRAMKFTKEEVVRRLDEGWSLSGDLSKEAPFSLLNPQYSLQAKMVTVPVAIVRELSQKKLLRPEPMPGKVMYRLAR